MTKAEAVYEAWRPRVCHVCGTSQLFYRLHLDTKVWGALRHEGRFYCRGCLVAHLGIDDTQALFQWSNGLDPNDFTVKVYSGHKLNNPALVLPFVPEKTERIDFEQGEE